MEGAYLEMPPLYKKLFQLVNINVTPSKIDDVYKYKLYKNLLIPIICKIISLLGTIIVLKQYIGDPQL